MRFSPKPANAPDNKGPHILVTAGITFGKNLVAKLKIFQPTFRI